MSLKTGAAILASLGAIIAATGPARPAAAQGLPIATASCPLAPDASKLPDAAALRQMNSITAHGPRPTGSLAQERYIAWIRDQLKGVDGIELSDLDYTISRFTPSSTKLKLRTGKRVTHVAVAGPVPYAK